MSDTRSARSQTVDTLAELIHEQSGRPWERSCVLAADLHDVLPWDQLRVLQTLAAKPAHVFTKAELVAALHHRGRPATTRALDSAAMRLRQRIIDATDARLVCNVWGVGYRLAPDAPEPFVSQLPTGDRPRLATSYGAVHGLPRQPGDDHYGLS